MMEINYKHLEGPFKDGTSKFEITFPEGLRFGDFIMHVHKESSFEDAYSWYGDVSRQSGDSTTKIFEYKNGHIIFNKEYACFDANTFYNAMFTKIVKRITAEGGFGRMNYTVWFEEDLSRN